MLKEKNNCKEHTKTPVVSANSMLAAKFENGVAIMTDTLVARGSYLAFQNSKRIYRVTPNTLLGFSGELSDFQELLCRLRKVLQLRSVQLGSEHALSPAEIFSFVSVEVQRARGLQTLLYLEVLVAGAVGNSLFLGFVDRLGNAFTEDVVCTGFNRQLAGPLLKAPAALHKDQLLAEMKTALTVNYYRNTLSVKKIEIGVVEVVDGVVRIYVYKDQLHSTEWHLDYVDVV